MEHFTLQKEFSKYGDKLYNKLAVGIVRLENFKDFKNILRTFPLDNSFYSTQEFFFFNPL